MGSTDSSQKSTRKPNANIPRRCYPACVYTVLSLQGRDLSTVKLTQLHAISQAAMAVPTQMGQSGECSLQDASDPG